LDQVERFAAPNKQTLRSEGIAGRAWNRRRPVDVHDLPEIRRENLSNGDPSADIQEYARKTNIDYHSVVERVEAGKNCPRSMHAMRIEVANRRWGVLVLDSPHPDGVKHGREWEVYQLVAGILSQVLEEDH
jgi:hypothetical protein